MNMSCIIPHQLEGEFKILSDGNYYLMFMVRNGYVNVTKMCKIENREFYRWKRLVNSNKIIEEINLKYVTMESSSLIYVDRKNNKSIYGFYAHPELALQIARWLSEDIFKVISKIINAYKEIYDTKNLLCLEEELCPYDILGECEKGDNCEYMHGDICDICGVRALHRNDLEQRKQHENICMKLALKNIDESYENDDNNRGDICGICLENIKEKPLSDRIYGILSHCNHMFCLKCIRTWMNTVSSRGRCPECRQESSSVIPSMVWIDKNDCNFKKLLV